MPVVDSDLIDLFVEKHGEYLPDTPGDILDILEGGLYRILGEAIAEIVQPAIEEGGGGATDHAALSNLAWADSDHTGTASHLAAFDGAGAATTVAQSSFATSGHDHDSAYSAIDHDHSGVYQPSNGYLTDIAAISSPTTGDLIRWNGTDWVKYADSNYAGSGHNHAHSSLSSLAWSSSGHTGTASYLAGFDGSGDPTDVDPATLTNAGWTYVVLASDFVTTSAALADTALSFTPAANTDYFIEIFLVYTSSVSTTGIEMSVTWPGGSTWAACALAAPTGTASVAWRVQDNGVNPVLGTNTANANKCPCWGWSIVRMGASPSSDFIVQVASEIGATTVTVKAKSFMRYRVIN